MSKSLPQVGRAAVAGGTALFVAAAMMLGATAASAAPADPATGSNVALASAGATVTASGQEDPGKWGPENAIDGIGRGGSNAAGQDSRWSSNHKDDAQITVELAKPTVIDHVAIEWEAACAASYKLQVSTDGTVFTDATDPVSPTCNTRDVEKLTKVDASTPYKFVRMQGLARTPIDGTKWGISLWEFEVWDGAEPAPVTDTAQMLVPKPAHLSEQADDAPFVLGSDAKIVADGDMTSSATFLATLLRGSTGYALPVVTSATGTGNIVFTKGAVSGYTDEDEAYALTTTADGVQITSPTSRGAFDAVQTLRQLFPAFVESDQVVDTTWSAPAVEITDAPRFAYRGIMLDSARSFLTVDEVKSMLDTMAMYKVSTMHFHLSDDQGWRIQITNDGKEAGDPIDYSLLTSVSGKTAVTQNYNNNEIGHTGYYTQDEYKDIVAYAQALHITVIPEIDAPAHTNAILHAIPQMNTDNTQPRPGPSGTVPANGSGSVGYSTLDANAPITWTFMRHVLGQIAAMTPGEYIHVGGDESHVTPHDDYVTFITKSVKVVHDLGKKMIGWNESAVAGLESGDAVQYWTGGTDETLAAVKDKGAKLVLSRGSSAYLDQKYNSKTPIGLSWAGGGDFPKYYDYDPASVVQDNGVNVPDSDILGVEGPMWSETIRGGSQAEFLAFPREISIAELGWTPQAERNVTDFTKRMAGVGQRLLVADSNFYDGDKAKWGWSMAGSDLAVAPDHELSLRVGELAAPGTKVSGDGSTIAVDNVDDADGVSASAISGDLAVTIDWGDGSATTDGTFVTSDPRTSLTAGSLYTVEGTHTYSSAGTYDGTLTTTDGVTSPFSVTVATGTPDPTGPPEWDSSQTPSLDTGDTADAGGRLPATFAGFEPGKSVTVTLGDTTLGTVLPGADGTIKIALPIPAGAYAGDAALTATQGSRTATATVTINSDNRPLANKIDQSTLTVESVDSQETVGEDDAATNAIDGDPSTFWHTQWQGATPAYPHDIVLNLGKSYQVTGFEYQQRPGQSNGRIKGYEVYVSDSTDDWGDPVATGEFLDVAQPQVIDFDTVKTGKYLKLVGTSSINGNNFAGAAEINVGGVDPSVPLPSVSVKPESVTAGDTVEVSVAHFAPNSSLSLTLEADETAGTPLVLDDSVATDDTGAATTQVAIPSDVSTGSFKIVATQNNDDGTLSASAALAVTAADDGGTPGGGDNGGNQGGDNGGNQGGDNGGNQGGGSGANNGGNQGGTTAPGSNSGSNNGSTGNGAVASATEPGTGLAKTGSSVDLSLFGAFLLLMAGGGVLVARRSRRTKSGISGGKQ